MGSLQISSLLLAWRPQNISHNIRSSSLTGCVPGNTHSLYLNRPESIFKVRFVKFHLTVTNQPTPWNWVRTNGTSASQNNPCILCNPEVHYCAHNSPPHESCPCSPFVLPVLIGFHLRVALTGGLFPSDVPTVYFLFHAYHMPYPSHTCFHW
jgi:hypothetical protein